MRILVLEGKKIKEHTQSGTGGWSWEVNVDIRAVGSLHSNPWFQPGISAWGPGWMEAWGCRPIALGCMGNSVGSLPGKSSCHARILCCPVSTEVWCQQAVYRMHYLTLIWSHTPGYVDAICVHARFSTYSPRLCTPGCRGWLQLGAKVSMQSIYIHSTRTSHISLAPSRSERVIIRILHLLTYHDMGISFYPSNLKHSPLNSPGHPLTPL